MVESLSKEMQNSPRVLQEEEPGGREKGGCISEPILRVHTLSPSSALCAHLTAPSLQAAATRGPGPTPGLSESSSQIARDMYLQGGHYCQET